MRYTTFRNLALVTGTVVLAGGGYWCGRSSTPPVQVVAAPQAVPAAAQPVTPARPPVPIDSYQSYLIGLLGRPAAAAKIKDGLRGPIKVNVYAEKGVWGRAKVDLDRDEKWDEKWSLEGTAIMRQVAPKDDEDYGDKTQVGSTAGR